MWRHSRFSKNHFFYRTCALSACNLVFAFSQSRLTKCQKHSPFIKQISHLFVSVVQSYCCHFYIAIYNIRNGRNEFRNYELRLQTKNCNIFKHNGHPICIKFYDWAKKKMHVKSKFINLFILFCFWCCWFAFVICSCWIN